MKNKLFDEHVKKQFDGYRPEVAPHIWENIAAAQRRRKPAPFWLSLFANKWMAAALFIAAATGAGIYISHHNTTKEETAAATTDKKNSTPQNNTATNNTNTSSGNNSSSPSANTGLQPNVAVPPANEDAANSTTGTLNNNNIAPQNNSAPGKNIETSGRRNTSRIVESTAYIGTAAGTVINAGDRNILNTNSDEQKTGSRILSSQTESASLLTMKYNTGPAKFLIKRNPFGSIPCPPAEKDAAGNKSYFELYAGPDYVFRTFSDTANSAYLRERKATVSASFSYSAGIRYTKVFRNGLSFRTGLNYSQINERFKYVKGNVTHNIYITNTAGDTTGTYVERGTQYQQSTNKYRSIDIPFVAGYELGNGRLHANVNAGVMVNILSRQKGYVLDPSGTPVDISSGKNKSLYSYKTNAGVSFLGAVSVYYKLNDRFHLLAEPYLRYGLSSMTRDELSLKQKNHTAGLRVGLRMDL